MNENTSSQSIVRRRHLRTGRWRGSIPRLDCSDTNGYAYNFMQ